MNYGVGDNEQCLLAGLEHYLIVRYYIHAIVMLHDLNLNYDDKIIHKYIFTLASMASMVPRPYALMETILSMVPRSLCPLHGAPS